MRKQIKIKKIELNYKRNWKQQKNCKLKKLKKKEKMENFLKSQKK